MSEGSKLMKGPDRGKIRRRPQSRKGSSKRPKNVHQASDLSLIRVVEGFHINFSKTEKHPTIEQLVQFDMHDVLTSLLSFISAEPITATEAIESVLNLKIRSPVLKWLYQYDSYDLPKQYEGDKGIIEKEQFDEVNMRMMNILEEIKSTGTMPSSEVSHVKSFFYQFFDHGLGSGEGLKYTGQTVVALPLPKIERVGEFDSRLQACEEYVPVDVVISKPDVVIGRYYRYPVIPVEIYSPHKFTQLNLGNRDCSDSEDSDTSLLSSSSSLSPSTSMDRCNFAVLKTFLKANLPSSFAGITGSVNVIKEKLIEQLLIQLLGCANNYVKEQFYPKDDEQLENNLKTPKKRNTFIGFLAVHFNLYIVKLTGFNTDVIEAGSLTWHRKNTGKYPLNVSFYPVLLDVEKPSHGIALLFFIRYYRNIFRH